MSVEETRTTLDRYLDALLNGGDFGSFFSDDVLWTTMETGEEIRGRGPVRDFILALHTHVFHASPEVRSITVADGAAGLEAVFIGEHAEEFAGIAPRGTMVRLPYAVFYDVEGGSITALRAYVSIAALTQQLRAADTVATV
jgi:ketosteroid isomerase-like protein